MKQRLRSNIDYFLLFIFFIGISGFLFIPILSNTNIPKVADILNHLVAIMQAKMAQAEGQWILRTAPSGHYTGFRYPLFQFYSPTSYTVTGYIYRWITPSNPFVAFKLTIWSAFVFGSIYVYRLAFCLVKSNPIAMLTVCVYLTAPYLIIVVNHFGGLNEAIALGIIPVVIFYTLQRYDHPYSDKNLLLMAFAWYVLATVHLITFIFTSLFIGIFLLFMTFEARSRWRHLLHVSIAYVFSCLLALWYLAPVALYSTYLFVSGALLKNQYPVSLVNLLSPVADVVNQVNGDVISKVHPSVGLPILLSVMLCFYIVICQQSYDQARRFFIISLMILFFIIFFMIWAPIHVWQWLPHSFGVIQYTWRLLGQTMWIGALLFAWSMKWVFQTSFEKKYFLIGILLLLLTATTWFSTPENTFSDFHFISNHVVEMFNPDAYLVNVKKSRANIIHDKTNKISFSGSFDATKILTLDKIPSACHQEAGSTICKINVPNKMELVELPIFYYPDMLHVVLNGKTVPYYSILTRGYLIIGVHPEAGKINNIAIQFQGLLWANFISLVCWMLFLFFVIYLFLRYLNKAFSQYFLGRWA